MYIYSKEVEQNGGSTDYHKNTFKSAWYDFRDAFRDIAINFQAESLFIYHI